MERSKPFFDGEVDLFADFPEPEDKVEVDPATDFTPEDFDFKEEPAEEIDFDAEPDNYFEVSFTTPEGQEIVAATADNETAGQLSHVETPMDLLNALISELGLEDQVELVDKDEEESEAVPAEETEDAAEETEVEETEVEGEEEIEESCKETINECGDPKLVESQAQEIGDAYARLSKRYHTDLEDLVYGADGFMATNYPDGFPDFQGDVIYSEKYWKELADWAKENRGIDLRECAEAKLAESQIDDFDTQIQSDELAELKGAEDPELTPEDYESETVVETESPLTPEEREELLALFGIASTDESLNASQAQKDAEKHSALATKNKSENRTLNEGEVHDEASEIDYYEQDIRDAIKLLARKGKAEFWCLWNRPEKAEEVVKRFKEKFGKDVTYEIEDELCTAKVVNSKTEDYTGTPEIRTTHLEYEDKDVTDGKAVLPSNITKKKDDHCKKVNKAINHTPDEQATLKESVSDEALKKMVEDLEKNEEEVECKWCDELYPKSDCRKEVKLGWLCPYCRQAIRAHGEPLTFIDDDFDESLEETTDQDLKDNRQPIPEVSKELDAPVDATEMRKHEAGIQEGVKDKEAVERVKRELEAALADF